MLWKFYLFPMRIPVILSQNSEFTSWKKNFRRLRWRVTVSSYNHYENMRHLPCFLAIDFRRHKNPGHFKLVPLQISNKSWRPRRICGEKTINFIIKFWGRHVGYFWTGLDASEMRYDQSARYSISSSVTPTEKLNMAESNPILVGLFSAISVGLFGIIFLVYKLRLLHRYIYKVKKFSLSSLV